MGRVAPTIRLVAPYSMRSQMKQKAISVLLLTLVLLLAFGSVALAQDKTLYWQRYDVDIAIQKTVICGFRRRRSWCSPAAPSTSVSVRSTCCAWAASAT